MHLSRILYVTITISVLLSTPIASARFHFSGGTVIDTIRLADSIRQTAQMVANATNTELILDAMSARNTGADLNSFWSNLVALSGFQDAITTGKSLLNVGKSPKNMANHKSLGVMEAIGKQGETHRNNVLQEASSRNMETLAICKASLVRASERTKLGNALISSSHDYTLAEAQKQNGHRITAALNSLESAKLTATSTIAQLQADQDELALARLEQQRKKQQVFKAYDPNNPTKLDQSNLKKIDSPSQDLGFISFGSR